VRGNELVEPTHALDALWQSRCRQPAAVDVLNVNVVMGFGPVMTNEHPRHRTS
jgi:hypothetical protein